MKNLFLFQVILVCCLHAVAQVGISPDGSPPDPSAMLEVKSNTRGFLPPRMTYSEIQAIASPEPGLIIFCTDCGSGTLVGFIQGALVALKGCEMPGRPEPGVSLSSATRIAWIWNMAPGATGYKWNRVNNYATATDVGNNTWKADTGLACNTTYNSYIWAYNACGNSPSVKLTQSTATCFTFYTCGQILKALHIAGPVAPVHKSAIYGTVPDIPGVPGKCWITSNLGADRQATDVSENTEIPAGWYWQFNRKQGYKHDGMNRTPSAAWITSVSENSDWLQANDPCHFELGGSWRIPTNTEWTNVKQAGSWANWNGPWSSDLKLHAAGNIELTGNLGYRGITGRYWSSTQMNGSKAKWLYFSSGSIGFSSDQKAYGCSLRCIKD